MSEQTPGDDPQLPDAPEPDAAPTEPKSPQRFALYDKTHQRFVGAVQDSRKAANGLKPAKGERHADHEYEVRGV